MQTEYLVIGSGIVGTLLSYELLRQKKSLLVIDDDSKICSSKVAGAIINPVTVKQWTIAKDYEQYIAAALECYRSLQSLLDIPVVSEIPVMAFDSNPAKEKEIAGKYLFEISGKEEKLLNEYFYCSTPVKKIFPSYQVFAGSLLLAWKKKLVSEKMLLTERFDVNAVTVTSQSVVYKNIQAKRIIFCEGAAGVANPFFPRLPFTKNRGDVLVLSIPGLSQDMIYHNGIRLIPFAEQLFWCGSNYTWDFTNLDPDAVWRKQTIAQLQHWLKLPFTVEDHIVAERPTTAGQIPLTLMHETLPVAMLNGLGTKGFLTAPLLAKQFADKLIKQ